MALDLDEFKPLTPRAMLLFFLSIIAILLGCDASEHDCKDVTIIDEKEDDDEAIDVNSNDGTLPLMQMGGSRQKEKQFIGDLMLDDKWYGHVIFATRERCVMKKGIRNMVSRHVVTVVVTGSIP